MDDVLEDPQAAAEWNRAAWVTLGQRTAKRWTWAWSMMSYHADPEQDFEQLRVALAAAPAEITDDRRELEQELRILEMFFDIRQELVEDQRRRFQSVVDECDKIIGELQQEAGDGRG